MDNHLYAVSPTGIKMWSVELEYYEHGSPAIGRDGTVYASAGPLYAVSQGGAMLWSSPRPGPVHRSSPVIGVDGSIYAAEEGTHSLYAFTPSGERHLFYLSEAVAKRVTTTPAIDRAGTIHYCVSNSVVALNPQGQTQWTVFAGYTLVPWILANTSPVIGPDGTLYAALGSKLYAIATGTLSPPDSPWPMYGQNSRQTGKVEKPALLNLWPRNDANFQFQLHAQLGQTNIVETSTNLISWTALMDVIVTNVPMDVIDLTASNSPTRFYRAFAP